MLHVSFRLSRRALAAAGKDNTGISSKVFSTINNSHGGRWKLPAFRVSPKRRLSTINPMDASANGVHGVSASTSVKVESNHKAIAYWLLGMGGLVAGMVTIGGVTRLTRSGLSMTDWTITGGLPPITQSQWLEEFERYKTFPEWKQRQKMTLEEFKFIYFWEYGHRMMGRFLGVAFVGPFLYFAARGRIPRSLYPRLGVLFSLGGMQGLIGWWMVKSGLDVDPSQRKEIRVSPYRLATHLSMAFTTYTLLIWTGMDLLNTDNKARKVAAEMTESVLKQAKHMRRFAMVNGALVAATVVSGAYVAGNDAGRAYNTFPMMNDEWIPSEIFDMKPLWRNFVENTATVQFDHRVLALTTMTSIMTMFASARGIIGSSSSVSQSAVTTLVRSAFWTSLPAYSRGLFNAVAGMSMIQVGLGIGTLLLYVPIPLAAVHQAGSLTLLTLVTALAHSLKFSRFPAITAASKTIRATAV